MDVIAYTSYCSPVFNKRKQLYETKYSTGGGGCCWPLVVLHLGHIICRYIVLNTDSIWLNNDKERLGNNMATPQPLHVTRSKKYTKCCLWKKTKVGNYLGIYCHYIFTNPLHPLTLTIAIQTFILMKCYKFALFNNRYMYSI